jgi:hypothetical protein
MRMARIEEESVEAVRERWSSGSIQAAHTPDEGLSQEELVRGAETECFRRVLGPGREWEGATDADACR